MKSAPRVMFFVKLQIICVHTLFCGPVVLHVDLRWTRKVTICSSEVLHQCNLPYCLFRKFAARHHASTQFTCRSTLKPHVYGTKSTIDDEIITIECDTWTSHSGFRYKIHVKRRPSFVGLSTCLLYPVPFPG